jgi:hypothetical protein
MARGKPWTDAEISLLKEMDAVGLSAKQIYDSGRLPGRTYQAIMRQLCGCRFVVARRKAFVETI